ncbi:hypothetical protein BC941DRAFT_422095 [Chlamydoabsidia padenii]|nr:hypothetical protein BC941DRAFT_422095 [Chlamydoabsidia padenii]
MVEESLKKFAVGEMPPSPTISNPISSNTTTTHKKPTRHHVKRRSSGRIHVSKLAPLAKVHTQQQPTTEDDDNFEDIEQQQQPRRPMKRSHSSKSIHRLSSNDPQRKVNLSGFTMTLKPTTNTGTDSPPMTPTELQEKPPHQSATPIMNNTKEDNTTPTISVSQPKPTLVKPISPTFQVSYQSTAAPIAHILNATVENMATPNKLPVTPTSASNSTKPMHHLHSRFIDQEEQVHHQDIPSHLYQQQQQQQHYLTCLLKSLDKEYQAIHTHQDPMMESLTRCLHQQRRNTTTHLHRLVQLQQQRTFSSSILPTLSTITTTTAAIEPLARQRHQRLLLHSHHHSATSSSDNKQGWGAFLDRMLYGAST